MGNSNSVLESNNTNTENFLIDEIKNTLNADTETFRPKKSQYGGITEWSVGQHFITPTKLRGVVINKRSEPHLVDKHVYRVKLNGVEETMWPESDMKKTPEDIKKEADEKHKKKVAAEHAAELKKQAEEQRIKAAEEAEEQKRASLETLQKKSREYEAAEEKVASTLKQSRVEELKSSKVKEAQIKKEIQAVESRINEIKSSSKPVPIKDETYVEELKRELTTVNRQIATLERI